MHLSFRLLIPERARCQEAPLPCLIPYLLLHMFDPIVILSREAQMQDSCFQHVLFPPFHPGMLCFVDFLRTRMSFIAGVLLLAIVLAPRHCPCICYFPLS